MIGNWQRTLANYWTNTQNETEATLQLVKNDFRCSGLSFDDNFKEYFLRETNDRVAQAYERYVRNAKFEEQFIAVSAQNHESTDKKTTTDGSDGTANINISNKCHQPATDSIAPVINQEVNSVDGWPHTLPSSTPFHGEPNNDMYQPFTTFSYNNIDPNNITDVAIANESILTEQISDYQATILSGIDRNENDIDSIETSTTACEAPTTPTSIQSTNVLIATATVSEINEVSYCPVLSKSIPVTPFRDTSEAQIPSDETLQRFASFVCNNIDPNNVTASLGVILSKDSMSNAQIDESQAIFTNGMATSEDDMRNNIKINEIANEMVANAHPDPIIISECDDMNALHAPNVGAINNDLLIDTMVVDLTTERDEASPANNQTNQKDVKQVTTNQRRKRKIEELSTSNGNSKKKRKIAPRSTLKTIPESTSDSPMTDMTGGKAKSVKQSKGVVAQTSQQIETNSNGAEKQKGSTSNGKSKTNCEFCNYVARCPAKLIEHIRIHTGEKPFECKICAKGFTTKGSLKTHMKTHANQFPFHCSICRQGFTVKRAKEIHEKSCNQRRYECYLCNMIHYTKEA